MALAMGGGGSRRAPRSGGGGGGGGGMRPPHLSASSMGASLDKGKVQTEMFLSIPKFG